jgi:hypothetical protein
LSNGDGDEVARHTVPTCIFLACVERHEINYPDPSGRVSVRNIFFHTDWSMVDLVVTFNRKTKVLPCRIFRVFRCRCVSCYPGTVLDRFMFSNA